jgi:hypothetical protein
MLKHLPVAALILAAALVAGCSKQNSAQALSADSPVLLEASSNYVTFQNKTGLTLQEVTLSILPYGPGEFTRLLLRVENTGRRQVPLNEFRGRDGTPLNLRVARPKTLRVKAQDSTGKNYEYEMAWPQ